MASKSGWGRSANPLSEVTLVRGLNLFALCLDQIFNNQGGAHGTLPMAGVRLEMLTALWSLRAERTAVLGKQSGPREAARPLVREPIRVEQDKPDVFPL